MPSEFGMDIFQRSGEKKTDDLLVVFLYTLLRDHLPAGDVETLMCDEVEPCRGQTTSLSNGWLADMATDLAARLR